MGSSKTLLLLVLLCILCQIRGGVEASNKGLKGSSKTVLFLLLLGGGVEARSPLSARIGGVFNSIDSALGSAFAQVVAEINNSSDLLPDTRLDQLTAYRWHQSFVSFGLLQEVNLTIFVIVVNTRSRWKV